MAACKFAVGTALEVCFEDSGLLLATERDGYVKFLWLELRSVCDVTAVVFCEALLKVFCAAGVDLRGVGLAA